MNIEEIQQKEFERIFNGNISEQILICRRFEHNLKTRNEIRLEKETESMTYHVINLLIR